jgi:multidrug efflux pump subunit AcrB
MASHSTSNDPVTKTLVQDPAHDAAHLDEASSAPTHTFEEEVAHAQEHFRENNFAFLCVFLPVILITFVAFNVDFGTWNKPITWTLAAVRSGLIAWFLATLFKQYSLVFRTLFFSFIFLLGMIFLSMWDSELVDAHGHGIGNPIYNYSAPASMRP